METTFYNLGQKLDAKLPLACLKTSRTFDFLLQKYYKYSNIFRIATLMNGQIYYLYDNSYITMSVYTVLLRTDKHWEARYDLR